MLAGPRIQDAIGNLRQQLGGRPSGGSPPFSASPMPAPAGPSGPPGMSTSPMPAPAAPPGAGAPQQPRPYNPANNLHGLTNQGGQWGVTGQHGGFQPLGQNAQGRVSQVLSSHPGLGGPQGGPPPPGPPGGFTSTEPRVPFPGASGAPQSGQPPGVPTALHLGAPQEIFSAHLPGGQGGGPMPDIYRSYLPGGSVQGQGQGPQQGVGNSPIQSMQHGASPSMTGAAIPMQSPGQRAQGIAQRMRGLVGRGAKPSGKFPPQTLGQKPATASPPFVGYQ